MSQIRFQGICFPVYGIPKVRRADYLIFDRGRLQYVARRLRSPHSRYPHFFDYGGYRERIETVRNDFVDLQSLMPAPPNPNPDAGAK